MRNSSFLLCVVLCVGLIAAPAWASPLLSGVSALAPAEPDPLGGVAVAGPLVSPLVGARFTATITSTVIAGDAANPFPGGLTFVYQVANSPVSIDALGRVTIDGYTGWLTDASFQPGPGLPPATMDRSTTGDVVGFSFVEPPLGPTALVPGSTSMSLVVQTNAPVFSINVGNVIDGSIAAGPVYAPNPVPEPGAAMLLLGGVALLMRRR